MMITSHMRARSGGIAVLLTSMMIIGVMMAVGLAVDVGMMYAVKTKLSAAADAAALAGARALGRAGSGGATGQAASTAYFNANMTTGYMMATNISSTVTGPTASGSIQTMTVNAQADLPLLFTRFIQNTQTIKVTASAQRQDVNMVMVLDRSGSMGSGPGSACDEMVKAAQDFTKQFVDGRDNVGLVVFGGSYDKAYNLSNSFKSGSPTINSVLATISCGGNTGSAAALWQAYQMLKTLNQPGALNVVVFFTDGQPNGLTADWPIATVSTSGISYATSSGGSGGVTSSATSPWFLGYPASTCNSGNPVTGFIARNGEQQHGVRGASTSSIGSDALPVSVSGTCAFSSNENNVHQDIAYIPATDTFGNSTSGYWDNAPTPPQPFPASILKITVGPYAGKVMLDHYQAGTCGGNPCGLYNNNIDLASMNAAEDAAYRARKDATLPVTFMAIGLGGASDSAPGQFLEHVANTQNSDLHASHTNEPTGDYVYVTGPGQLGSAFQQIASFVQRLSS